MLNQVKLPNKVLFLLILTLCSLNIHGHSGRTDSSGCHSDNIYGGRHCHNSGDRIDNRTQEEKILDDNDKLKKITTSYLKGGFSSYTLRNINRKPIKEGLYIGIPIKDSDLFLSFQANDLINFFILSESFGFDFNAQGLSMRLQAGDNTTSLSYSGFEKNLHGNFSFISVTDPDYYWEDFFVMEMTLGLHAQYDDLSISSSFYYVISNSEATEPPVILIGVKYESKYLHPSLVLTSKEGKNISVNLGLNSNF